MCPPFTSAGAFPRVTVTAGLPVAVLEAMNYHLTSEKLQVEGCLALGNIGRIGEGDVMQD